MWALCAPPPARLSLLTGAKVELGERLPARVAPDLLEGRDDRAHVGARLQKAQRDKVAGHPRVVLVDGVDDGVDERRLAAAAELRDVAKVDVGDAAVGQGEDVARVGVAVLRGGWVLVG